MIGDIESKVLFVAAHFGGAGIFLLAQLKFANTVYLLEQSACVLVSANK